MLKNLRLVGAWLFGACTVLAAMNGPDDGGKIAGGLLFLGWVLWMRMPIQQRQD